MLTILPYTDALAPAFRDINTAWIADMFTLEPHDEHVLSHPREAIIDRGGVILFVAHSGSRRHWRGCTDADRRGCV
ncbi:hypothetical protein JW805_18185 [Roseomonas aeriglobus]|nr:hypothetical protein [Roseomonas aeriglobus]